MFCRIAGRPNSQSNCWMTPKRRTVPACVAKTAIIRQAGRPPTGPWMAPALYHPMWALAWSSIMAMRHRRASLVSQSINSTIRVIDKLLQLDFCTVTHHLITNRRTEPTHHRRTRTPPRPHPPPPSTHTHAACRAALRPPLTHFRLSHTAHLSNGPCHMATPTTTTTAPRPR